MLDAVLCGTRLYKYARTMTLLIPTIISSSNLSNFFFFLSFFFLVDFDDFLVEVLDFF